MPYEHCVVLAFWFHLENKNLKSEKVKSGYDVYQKNVTQQLILKEGLGDVFKENRKVVQMYIVYGKENIYVIIKVVK